MARSHRARAIPRPAGARGVACSQYGDHDRGRRSHHRLRGRALAAGVPLSKVTGWRVAAWAPLSWWRPAARGLDALPLVGSVLLVLSAAAGARHRRGDGGADRPADACRTPRSARASRCQPLVHDAARGRRAVVGARRRRPGAARPARAPRHTWRPSCPPRRAPSLSLAPDGIIRTWNAAAEQLFGYPGVRGHRPDGAICSRREDARQASQKLYAERPRGRDRARRRRAPAQGRPSDRRRPSAWRRCTTMPAASSASPRCTATSASARRARSTSSS